MPMPNVFSVLVKDTTGMLQLMSQGTADLIADTCSEYWDGKDLCPLGERERKKIADFYQRTSMSSYCTAFSYRPLSKNMGNEYNEMYIEIPECADDACYYFRSPSLQRIWDVNTDRHMSNFSLHRYCSHPQQHHPHHGSIDSLMKSSSLTSVHDTESCFSQQCNQIFIGMITMQYQAKQDIVKLIDDLELACIRFVHFSKENELRSRVFAEKMGLEAGWNCHISLLSNKKRRSSSVAAPQATAHNASQPNDADLSDSDMDDCIPSRNVTPTPNAQGAAGNTTIVQVEHHHPALNRHFSSTHSSRRDRMHQSTKQRAVEHNSDTRTTESGGPTRWLSAPGSINVMTSQVKFDSADPKRVSPSMTPSHTENCSNTVSPEAASPDTALHTAVDTYVRHTHSDQVETVSMSSRHTESEDLLGGGEDDDKNASARQQQQQQMSYESDTHHVYADIRGPPYSDNSIVVSSQDVDDEYIQCHGTGSTGGGVYREGAENMSSTVTDNTDSVTYHWSNRAKLPRGIETIRNHIETVDNVPLLVSLFTDCTAKTTKEMLEILQEYDEVVCCVGSSANIHNTDVFLQSDCSLAIEPQYPQLCVSSPVTYAPWDDNMMTPMQLNAALHSIPCSLAVHRNDSIMIVQLIAQGRSHCQNQRGCMLSLLMMQLAVCLLLLLNHMLLLPPCLTVHCTMWCVIVVVPALATIPLANPIDVSIMKDPLGKNAKQIPVKVIVEFSLYFIARFLPSLLVCLICHMLTLSSFCEHFTAHNPNITCHMIYGNLDYNEQRHMNGWLTEYSQGLNISQNFVSMQLIIYFTFIVTSYIHRYIHIWKRPPFTNKLWCVAVPCILLLQFVYCTCDIVIHQNSASLPRVSPSHVPMATWLLAGLWPLVLLPFLELVKYQEIRLYVRYQKRARLDFGTKLGMNSPF